MQMGFRSSMSIWTSGSRKDNQGKQNDEASDAAGEGISESGESVTGDLALERGNSVVDHPGQAQHVSEPLDSVADDGAPMWILPQAGSGTEFRNLAVGHYRGRVAAIGSSAGLEGIDEIKPTIVGRQAGVHVPDTAVEVGYVSDSIYLGAVSMRGAAHHADSRQVPRQDDYSIATAGPWLIAAIADGVGQGHMFSHIAARVAVAAATKLVRKAVAGATSLHDVAGLDWRGIAESCRYEVESAARTALASVLQPADGRRSDTSQAPLHLLASHMGTTLDIAVCATGVSSGDEATPFCWVRISGDGSAYVLDSYRGWHLIEPGKNSEGMVDNAVIPLPMEQGAPRVVTGGLVRGQALVMVTDGFGDVLFHNGAHGPQVLAVGGYLYEEWRRGPMELVEFLRVSAVLNANASDDRTAVVVWRV
ncbi:MAG: protein phosphatase 2C domain-containing protein [Gordonia sp. (in: high G+C Gram-positive bacteria)]